MSPTTRSIRLDFKNGPFSLIMKPDISMSSSFDRPKLLLFKFLAHQIHPFAYAVNTFLQPALDDCRKLIRSNPQDTLNVLLSLTQTFTRFAPDSEMIYDDIQQFAGKLKDALDECSLWLDSETLHQSSQLLEIAQQSLLSIAGQQHEDRTGYTDMYKNLSAVLTNLEKLNSLPVEMQTVLLNETLDKTIPIQLANKHETVTNTNGHSGAAAQNGHHHGNGSVPFNRPFISSTPTPAQSYSVHGDKSSVSTMSSSVSQIPISRTSLNSVQPATAATTSITTKLMNQMKSLSVSSVPPPMPSPPSSTSSRSVSTVSSMNDYDTITSATQSYKKATAAVAAFPPRQSSSLFPPMKTDGFSDGKFVSKSSVASLSDQMSDYERETMTPTPSNEGGIRFGTTPAPYSASIASSVYEEDQWDDEKSRQYYLDPRFSDPLIASADWQPARGELSTLTELSHLAQTHLSAHPHITDEYIQEFGNKQTRPVLRGDLCMTYGTPQSGPQSTCLPIGIGLSYNEMTLLSCDVHRSSQNVRLFDIQTGRLKHTIASNQQMKFHRPSAVMSNARNNVLIVERDFIYVTEPDGRLVQTIGHRSIKQLYGIAMFHDRYLLTIDSKATDNQTAENSRLLLFDPNSGQLVFEQRIMINRESEEKLKQQSSNHIKGKILPETSSKPRFLAVHNDQIYVADLGRSLIYGASIRNHFDFHCTTAFGGQGRGNGEMTDPSGLFVDSGGNIVSADSKNDRIQIFSSTGEYKASMKLNERIKRPSGICANRAGTQLYVSCYLAGCVRAFNISY